MAASPLDFSQVTERAAALQAELNQRSGGLTRLLAVTKGFPADAVAAAQEAGLNEVGENYAQEMLAKQEAINDPKIAWHMIGAVQRNKVKHLAGRVTLWQTVDRPSLVDEIAKRDPGAAILVQFAPWQTAGKNGCSVEDLEPLVARGVAAGLKVKGLMTVGVAEDEQATIEAFKELVKRADQLSLPERSMGMSNDLAVAVDCGSTLVRIGRSLFGDRPPRQHSS